MEKIGGGIRHVRRANFGQRRLDQLTELKISEAAAQIGAENQNEKSICFYISFFIFTLIF